MNKQLQYILLPTSRSKITLCEGTLYCYEDEKVADSNHILNTALSESAPQHFYILSEDEIKEGDWVLVGNDNHLRRVSFNDTKNPNEWIVIGESNAVLRSACKKIIATTNPELTFDYYDSDSYGIPQKLRLPSISQSDIEYIISLYNGKGKKLDFDKLAKKHLGINESVDMKNYDEFYFNPKYKNYLDYISGYNQCLQDNADKKFTLEDAFDKILKALPTDSGNMLVRKEIERIFDMRKEGHSNYRHGFLVCAEWYKKQVEQIIQSLTKEQPKSDIVMVEYEETPPLNDYSVRLIPKIKNGHIVIVRD